MSVRFTIPEGRIKIGSEVGLVQVPIRRWSCPDVKRMSLLSRWQKEPALSPLSDLKNAKGRLSNVMDEVLLNSVYPWKWILFLFTHQLTVYNQKWENRDLVLEVVFCEISITS